MKPNDQNTPLEPTIEFLQSKIFFIRGKKVMFDRDLAVLYGVEVKQLNLAVKRNIKRFPHDFMFQLNKDEHVHSRFQNETLNRGKNIKYNPHAFTEQGVAMLSSVLRSDRAIQVNIQIMRMFSRLREIILNNEFLKDKIEALEREQQEKFKIVFNALELLLEDDSAESPPQKMGFQTER
jgi:phage regulator Rha-like protein